jgi:hypothetical protein
MEALKQSMAKAKPKKKAATGEPKRSKGVAL